MRFYCDAESENLFTENHLLKSASNESITTEN